MIVTGASGFIGRNFLLRLPGDWEVTALYHRSQDFLHFVTERKLANIAPMRCDLTREEDVNAVAKSAGGADACVYLAANGDPAFSATDPLLDLRQNVVALVNFLRVLQVKRFVFFSSGAVYDGLSGLVSPDTMLSPRLPYAISKLASEQYVRFFAGQGRISEYVILRFFGAYGPYEPERKIYTRLIRAFALEAGNEFTVRGDGENLIDAMHVDDTVEGILKAVVGDGRNLVVDFATGSPMTVNELVRKAAAAFHREPIVIRHEGAVPEYIRFRVSREGMKRHFGFEPKVPLEEGLMRSAEFLKGRESVPVRS
jgi:UDP-glucose 4-epimerase